MKKSLILILFLSLSLTACTNNNQAVDDSINNSSAVRPDGMKRPDFGQPDREADIRGLVGSITGNEVTILKIERPQFNREQEDSQEKEENSEEDASQTTFGINSGGRMPGMGGRGGRMGGTRPELDDDVKEQMMERIKEMATGQETVLIPVGIQMLKPDTSSGSKKIEMLEASLEDVKKNTMVEIWLDESVEDRQVASFVLMLQ